MSVRHLLDDEPLPAQLTHQTVESRIADLSSTKHRVTMYRLACIMLPICTTLLKLERLPAGVEHSAFMHRKRKRIPSKAEPWPSHILSIVPAKHPAELACFRPTILYPDRGRCYFSPRLYTPHLPTFLSSPIFHSNSLNLRESCRTNYPPLLWYRLPLQISPKRNQSLPSYPWRG